MLVLLPPSEGKASPESGPHLDLDELSFHELTPVRERVLVHLESLCRTPDKAAQTLGLGPSLQGEATRNSTLRTAPCAPAIEVYAGVLYEALDVTSLTVRQRQRLNDVVAVGSALWGLVRPSDAIPAYRMSGGTTLPGLGPVNSTWQGHVTQVLAEHDGAILDLRSAAYQFGRLPARDDVAIGRVLLDRDGRRSVVSHHNKATKGRLIKAIAQSRKEHRSLDDIAATARSLGMTCELHESPKGPARMDFVVAEV